MNENGMHLVRPSATRSPVPGPGRVEGHPGPGEAEDEPVPVPARFEIYRDPDNGGWRLHDRDRNRAVKCRSHSEAIDRMNTRMAAELFGRRAA